MTETDYTRLHRERLNARIEAARDARRAEAAQARAKAAETAPALADDPAVAQWNAFGYWAMLACIWFVFIAPIALVLSVWD